MKYSNKFSFIVIFLPKFRNRGSHWQFENQNRSSSTAKSLQNSKTGIPKIK